MSSGQMNFNMRFTADTSQAQSSIQQLQTSLSQIAMANSSGKMEKGMAEAATAAKELSYHLNQAYNSTTGNFDLSRLDKSLKASGTNVTKLSTQLLQAGQSGQQAFVQLAQSIAAADRPMVTLGSRMSDFATTMKNTAKWQISSSVLHGFMGAVQSAYGYAQDLNESLNNIRIVTGYSTDQMAAFAEKANKAAKALSTTTTQYTDAALIYYQQGLGDKEIEERTATTIKMANVSGQSAEVVSDQMTAVWNNFYDGSKSLEYYADVMTKLGAATASSSDEIAAGLEKFAAVSDTVGLSYEYATAALATVTAETRQSADTVGTAFKTLFARIQGLKLGETLEDGTTLNDYSEALAKVGVDIKTANGDLKDMDTILTEMASVWTTLNKDEQVALAQKVAGVRQYTQLVALMDKWDVMETNLGFVADSDGALQEQADIYAESWQAASDRVKASMESIYSDLIDDEFFIDLTNGFSSLIDSLDAFVDGFGGVKMIVMSVASILMSTFAHKIPGALENLKANFNVVFKGASAQAQVLTQDFNNVINAKLQDPNLNFNKSQETALTNAKLLNEAKSKMLSIQDKMTGKERQLADTELSIISALEQETQQLADQITKRQQEIALLKEEMSYESADDEVYKAYGDQESALAERYAAARQGTPLQEGDSVASTNKALQEQRALINQVADARKEYISILAAGYEQEMAATSGQIENSTKVLSLYNLMKNKIDQYVTTLESIGEAGTEDIEQQKASFREVAKEISLIVGDSCPQLTQAINKALDADNVDDFKAAIAGVSDALKQGQIEGKNFGKILKQFGQGTYVDKMNKSYKGLNQTTKDLIAKQDALNQKIKDFNPTHVVTGLEKITAVAGGLGQVAMLATSARSIFQAWSNDDLSFGEKLTTTFMGLSMALPSAIGAFKTLNSVLGLTAGVQQAITIATIASLDVQAKELATKTAAQIVEEKGLSLDAAKVVSIRAKTLASTENLAAMSAERVAEITGMTVEQAATFQKHLNAGATVEQALAETGLTGAKTLGTFATIAQTIAQKLLNIELGTTATLVGGVVVALLAFLAAMAAIALIITGVVVGIKALNDAYNADSIAAENAKKAANNLAEKYSEVKEKYEEMISTMENYKTAREGLSSLTEGTEEYRKKLNEANDEALKLIELLGLIKGFGYTITEDGEIIIEENSSDYQNKKEQQFKDTQIAYAASLMADAQSNKANAQSSQTNFQRDQFQNTIDNTDSFFLKMGAGIIHFMSEIIQGFNYEKTAGKNQETDSKIDKLEQLYLKIGNAAFDPANLNQMGYGALSPHDIKELKSVVEANVMSAQGLETAAQLSTQALLETQTNMQNIPHKEEIVSSATDLYLKEYEKAYADILLKTKNNDIFGIGSEQNEEVWEDYSKLILKDYEDLKVTNYKKGGDIDYSYTKVDEEGKEITETGTVTQEEMAGALAAQQASENLLLTSNTLIGVVTKLGEKTSSEGKLMFNSLDGNLDNASYNDLASMSMTREDVEAMAKNIGEKLGNEEHYKLLGYKSFDAYVDGLMENMSSGALDRVSFLEEVKKTLSSEELKALGYENAEDYVNAFQTQYSAAMAEWQGLEDYKDYSLGEARTLNQVSAQTGLDSTVITDYYNSLNEEEKKIFLELDFNKETTKENWDNAIEEIKDQKIQVFIEQESSEKAAQFGLNEEDVKSMTEAFTEMEGISDDVVDTTEEIAESASDAAVRYLRLQDAVLDLSENYDDYSTVLNNVQKSSTKAEKADAMRTSSAKKLKSALAGLLGTSEDLINADLLEAIDPKDFESAARGDVKAIQKIRDAFIKLQAEANGIDFEGLKGEIDSLEEGATIDINADTYPFLHALLQAKVNAGASATEIENLLSGFNIDADVSEFCGSMEQMKAASADAATEVIQNTSYTQEVETVTGESVTDHSEVQWESTYTPTLKAKTSYVLMDGAEEAVPVEEKYYEWDKTVTPKEVNEQSTEEVQGTSVNTTNAAGESGNVKGVQIKNAHKSTGGSVSPSTSGAANDNMDSGGGGGGGGSGGSESKPAKKIKKTHKSDVVERYKKLNDALDDVNDALEKANMETDRMFGQARIKGMKQVNELTRQEVNLLKKKADEAKKYMDADQKELNQVASENGIIGEFTFDNKGNITNYEAQMNQLYKELNAAETHQDSLSTQEEQDEYQETVDKINDRIDAVKEAMERYEESREELEELEKQIREKEIEIEDRELEIFVYEIELKITVDQHELDYLEYLLEEMEDLAFKSAERISNIFARQAESYRNQIATTRSAISKLLKENGFSKEDIEAYRKGETDKIDWSKYVDNFTDAEMQQLEEWNQQLLEYNSSLMEVRRLVHEEVMVAFEEWNEELDKNIGYIDHYGTMVDHLQNISDLTKSFTGTDAKFMDNLAKARVAVAQDKAKAAKAQYNANVKSLEEAQAALQNAKDKGYSEAEIQMWQDTVDQMQEAVYESEDELYSAVTEVVEAAADRYEQAMDNAFKTFEKAIAGQAGSLEELSTQMDRAKQTSEQYLKDYQKIYELTKLNRKITDSIDESSNVKAKQALRDLQKEINEYQKEGNEMSQYDLEYLQKKYDLRLAQIALEEARDAKNQVRLTRDAEGNYGYTYTADQENVDNAQQNYEDKLYELQSLSDNYLTELQNNIVSTQQEYADALREIYERQKEGYYQSEEEFQAALEAVNEHYTGHLEYLYDEMDKACGNNAKLYESDWSTYNGFVGGKINDNAEFITSFDQTMLSMQSGFTDTETAMKTFKDAIGSVGADGKGTGLLGDMNTAFSAFETSTTAALKRIGVDGLGNLQTVFKTKIGSDKEKDSILGKSNTAKNAIISDAKQMIGNKDTGIKAIIASVKTWEKEHSKAIDNIIKKNKLALQAYNALYAAAALKTDDGKKNPPKDPPKDPPADTGGDKTGDGKLAVGDTATLNGSYYYDSYGTSPAGNHYSGVKNGVVIDRIVSNPGAKQDYYIHIKGADGKYSDLGWVKKSQLSGYDTGGYTGEWGSDGKLALLHEKELVLNKEDTANLLTTVSIVRELSDMLDIYAKQAALGLQMMQMSTMLQATAQELQQEVTIHAEFPNVSDRNEIQEAFDNLINRASQFAYRTK